MLDKKVILVGYSGHGIIVADVAQEKRWKIIGYAEKKEVLFNPFNLKYFGQEMDDNFFASHDPLEYILGIGNNYIREKIFTYFRGNNKQIPTLISSSANISNSVKIGNGVFVNKNVSVNAFVKIGDNVILNTGCIIEHGCEIQNHVHIAPGAVLAGNVIVGRRSFIGANSVIKEGVVIGNDVIVGAGSVVIKDIPSKKKIVGNPTKFI